MKSNSGVPIVAILLGLMALVVLAGLMLPAIQSARDSGRSAQLAYERSLERAEGQPAQSYTGSQDDLALAFVEPATAAAPETPEKPGAAQAPEAPQAPAGPQTPDARANRRIIYTARIELVVDDFAAASQKVLALVSDCAGYIANSDVRGERGETRGARWSIRVPVERFDDFVRRAYGLGKLVSATTSSNDVSAEYVDVEARIRNKTKEEARLLALLENRPGKLDDVIALERELTRVREEVERMQARIRMLADQTALTSVELSLNEAYRYQPAETAPLPTRIAQAFGGSLYGLRTVGEALLVALVAIGPWLVALAVFGMLFYPLWRPLVRKASASNGNVA